MLTWVVTLYDNATEPRRRARLPSLPRLTTIPNRKCRCVQHRHPERPTEVEGSASNRKFGIRNPNNHCISNHFHFSNRKYSAIFLGHRSPNLQPQSLAANRDTAIRNPNKPPYFNHFQFSISRQNRCFALPPCTTLLLCFPASLPPLGVSVPPWPIFAIMAGSN